MENTGDTKNIKVSPKVHEELEVRKYRDETFDEVLKRVLGLVPQTKQEITTALPDELRIATRNVLADCLGDDDRFERIGEEAPSKQILNFVSRETNKAILKVVVYHPDPPDRVNYRVDIRYRDPSGEMRRAAQFRDVEENAVSIEYRDSQTLEEKENTRKGEEAGEKAADLVAEHVADLVTQSWERWGQHTETAE